MNVRVRITCSGPAPASRSAARMIARTRRAWISGSGSQEPSGQIGAVPDTSTRFPIRTALLNPIFGSYGDPEAIRCRSAAIDNLQETHDFGRGSVTTFSIRYPPVLAPGAAYDIHRA